MLAINIGKANVTLFPRTRAKTQSRVVGFKTGDMVAAHVSVGKKKGTHKGKVAVRASGFFNITTSKGVVQGINAKYCKRIHACDGYRYDYTNCASSMPLDNVIPEAFQKILPKL